MCIYIYTRSSGPRFARPSLLLNYSLSSYTGLMNGTAVAPVQMFVMHGKNAWKLRHTAANAANTSKKPSHPTG